MQTKFPVFCLLFAVIFVAQPGAMSPPDAPINIMQSQGIVGLNFTGSGNNEQIAIFIIHCNLLSGFDVTFTFTNGGKFKSGTKEIPMTALVLDKVSGTLGAGLDEPVDVDVLNNLSGNDYVWDPGASQTPETGQTTETVNYVVELRASWNNLGGLLAGFYYETITATIAAGI